MLDLTNGPESRKLSVFSIDCFKKPFWFACQWINCSAPFLKHLSYFIHCMQNLAFYFMALKFSARLISGNTEVAMGFYCIFTLQFLESFFLSPGILFAPTVTPLVFLKQIVLNPSHSYWLELLCKWKFWNLYFRIFDRSRDDYRHNPWFYFLWVFQYTFSLITHFMLAALQ